MKKFKLFIQIFIVSLLLGFVEISYAQILFEDNFDHHSDWSPPQSNTMDTSYTTQPLYPTPLGYSDWRVGRSQNSEGIGHNTLNIDSTQYRGASGKAFVFWTEMTKDWGGDGLLGVDLKADNPEIYIRFYIKFQGDWKWRTTAYNQIAQKLLHVSHYDSDNSAGLYDYFSSTQNKPRYIMAPNIYNDGQADVALIHLLSWFDNGSSRKELDYFPGGMYRGGGTDWETNASDYNFFLKETGLYNDYLRHNKGMMGDGDWHCWEWRFKMNSADGVSDGIFTFWQDGIPLSDHNNILWANTESQSRGWNHVWLGGNNINTYGDESEPWKKLHEQWYAIDDFVISTDYIGPDNCLPRNVRVK